MSIIKSNVKNSGVTTYKIGLDAVRKLVAADLDVPSSAVKVDSFAVRRGESYMNDGYDEFAGLTITVDNDEAEKQRRFAAQARPQIDSPCCGENRKQ
jgi:hypothetical protein